MKQEVFEPLGMTRSGYEPDFEDGAASGYRPTGKYRPRVEYAAGGLWTTPTDLAKYVIELQKSYQGQSNKVLTKESVDFIFRPIEQELPRNFILKPGLGSFLLNKGGGAQYFFHAGEGSGFTGMFIGSFEGGKGAVVLTNGQDDGIVYSLISRIAEVYEWEDYLIEETRPEDVPEDLDPDVLGPYVGRFQCLDHPESSVDISIWEDKRLSTIFTGGEHAHPIWFHSGSHGFWAESFSLYSYTTLQFMPDADGAMNRFALSNADNTTNWVRVNADE